MVELNSINEGPPKNPWCVELGVLLFLAVWIKKVKVKVKKCLADVTMFACFILSQLGSSGDMLASRTRQRRKILPQKDVYSTDDGQNNMNSLF